MSIRNKKKDHLKDHSGVELVVPAVAPTTDDPLRFWTGHPTKNTLIDLHEFADGASTTGNSTGGGYSGRPELIAELAPAIQAQLALKARETCASLKVSLRIFWRVCDELEAIAAPDGRTLDRLTSMRDLTHLHETTLNRANINRKYFCSLLIIFNNTRTLMKLRPLVWTIPKGAGPSRQLIPDSHAKVLKIAIKRDWEQVRKTWARHDAIRRGEEPDTLTEFEKQDPTVVHAYADENELLRKNWLHFKRIQESTRTLNPIADQLYDGNSKSFHNYRGLYTSTMRALAFPTMQDAQIAFHAALIRSGWNPSTLTTGLDATLPDSIFQHPKDSKQRVLVVNSKEGEETGNPEDSEEINMQGSKSRAGGRMQFCMGLKKDPDTPPNIVAAFLARSKGLREKLHQDVKEAAAEYQRLKVLDAPRDAIERQFMQLQNLQQGTRNVWLYVDYRGNINWLNGRCWKTLGSRDPTSARRNSTYLEILTKRLNSQREKRKEEPIALVTPSDFRDIYARWVYVMTGGNILAVMLALGHSSLKPTDGYVTNNIFNAENDEAARKFMTHLFAELGQGRLDLTILAQLVRHGSLTIEMLSRLTEYRALPRSVVKVGCADIRNPPPHVDPAHIEGKRCGTHRCLRDCHHARFLPESLDGITMRMEELMVMSHHLPLDLWILGEFEKELEAGEYLLAELYDQDAVAQARTHWHQKIGSGQHVVPGVGLIHEQPNEQEAA